MIESIYSVIIFRCWWGYNLTPLYWILEGPRLAVILLNFFFLLNIVRVLVVKLRQSHTSEVEQVLIFNINILIAICSTLYFVIIQLFYYVVPSTGKESCSSRCRTATTIRNHKFITYDRSSIRPKRIRICLVVVHYTFFYLISRIFYSYVILLFKRRGITYDK